MAAKHQYMDSISGFYTFFLIQNGSFAPVHRISFRRSGRNRHKSARATFFSLEEGSNFVQKSRQKSKRPEQKFWLFFQEAVKSLLLQG